MKRRDGSALKIAEERIRILYGAARKIFKDEPALARRYLELARQIGMRKRVRIPPELKYITCTGCRSLLIPGLNCRVRIRSHRGAEAVMTCLTCGAIKRYPTTKEQQQRRRLQTSQKS